MKSERLDTDEDSNLHSSYKLSSRNSSGFFRKLGFSRNVTSTLYSENYWNLRMEIFHPKFKFLSQVYPLRFYLWIGGVSRLLNRLIFFKSAKGCFGTILIIGTVTLVPWRLRLVGFIPFWHGITCGTEWHYFSKTAAMVGKVLTHLGGYHGMLKGIFKFLTKKEESGVREGLKYPSLCLYWARHVSPEGSQEHLSWMSEVKLASILLRRFCFSILTYIIKPVSTGLDSIQLENEVRF